MSDPVVMVDSMGNPLSVGLSVLWKSHGGRDLRVGWIRDIGLVGGKPAARIDDGAEWDADLSGRTWSIAEWVTDPRKIRPRREQPLPDPRIAELTAEVERLRATADPMVKTLAALSGCSSLEMVDRLAAISQRTANAEKERDDLRAAYLDLHAEVERLTRVLADRAAGGAA